MLDSYANLPFDPKREMMAWINARLGETGLRKLDPEIMSPIGVDGKARTTERTVAVHWYAMSWATRRRKFARWLSWHGMNGIVEGLLRLRRSVLFSAERTVRRS